MFGQILGGSLILNSGSVRLCYLPQISGNNAYLQAATGHGQLWESSTSEAFNRTP
jgi:hypothetical protein